MASRMERYSKTEKATYASARSDRNKSLYKQIEDLDSYTNIAGIATIENKNSIDLEKVKELLRSRESKEEIKIKEIEEELIEDKEEVRSYDIKSLLSQIKESDEDKKYRSLSAKQHKILKELNKKSQELKEEELELDELVKTISNMKPLEEGYTDDVGLLDDLKSDTMIGDAPSIKEIIEEEKNMTKEFDDMEVDKSFYTSSFGFTQRDFEELKDINHKIKKDNKFIITLLLILIVLIFAVIVYFVII